MKKHLSAILCSLVVLCWASGALAASSIDLNYAFTSDNYVTSFSLIGPGEPVDLGLKTTEWQYPALGSYEGLLAGTTYTLQWVVVNGYSINDPQPAPFAGPMAFLGQFSVSGLGEYLSSSDSTIWKVNGLEPTSYGLLSSTGTWRSGYDTLKNFFDPAVQWIGYGSLGLSPASMTVSATFTTAPVPIPGAALLLGSAILGLVGIRRRQLV